MVRLLASVGQSWTTLRRRFGRAVAVCVALVALLGTPMTALADPDSPSMPPRDVAILVQPSAAGIPARPADFQRIERGWLTLELPASVGDRAEGLVREAQEFRTGLSG